MRTGTMGQEPQWLPILPPAVAGDTTLPYTDRSLNAVALSQREVRPHADI